ncbi:MAG TPA: L-rhamnose mutarotase [Spirochaetia bacterium]|nr:L-rhamnose mutarotase [Spirochaetia bacterium]
MKTTAFRMKIKKGFGDEYKRRHDEIWPELRELLKGTGVSDYYIFLDESTGDLFAVQNQSGESSSQELGNVDIVRKWWEYMADIMEVNPDKSPVSIPLKEVFYLQ